MIEDKLQELGFTLPTVPKPVANYLPAKRYGQLILTAGQLPFVHGELTKTGRIGEDLTVTEGQQQARLAVLNALAAVHSLHPHWHDLEILRMTGYLQTSSTFTDHADVLNGASDFLVHLFGEKGRHARTAIGMYTLPKNSPVEIELMVMVKESNDR